ncbi:MAG: ABC transporter permease subunit, partial [Caldimicrobium sp.]
MKKLFINSYSLSLLIAILVIILGLQTRNTYLITILIFAGLNALSALALSLLMGLAGQISLGQNGFYGLGAYFSAILCLNYNLPPLVSILTATTFSSLLGALLALPAIRLKGHYLAVATLAFGEIVYLLLNEWGPGGPSGFGNIPTLGITFSGIDYSQSYLLLVWSCWWVSFAIL